MMFDYMTTISGLVLYSNTHPSHRLGSDIYSCLRFDVGNEHISTCKRRGQDNPCTYRRRRPTYMVI
jgi:hypothetical protein